MKVIITIDDVSHIIVPDNVDSSCRDCSLREVCMKNQGTENLLSSLCGYFSMGVRQHFELLIPETKSIKR